MAVTKARPNFHTHADAIKNCGYTVVPSALSPAQIETAKVTLNAIFMREKSVGSSENFAHPQYQISLCLPAKDKVFRDLCLLPEALELSRLLLGQDCVVTSMNG